MENKNIFVDGLLVSKPSENAPDFIKLNFGAKVDQLTEFLNKHKDSKGWVNFNLKKSKEGKLYLALNTWNKSKKEEATNEDTSLLF